MSDERCNAELGYTTPGISRYEHRMTFMRCDKPAGHGSMHYAATGNGGCAWPDTLHTTTSHHSWEPSMPDRRHIVLYRDRRGAWRFMVVGGNGEIIATGEGYTRKWNAKRAAHRLWPTLPVTTG